MKKFLKETKGSVSIFYVMILAILFVVTAVYIDMKYYQVWFPAMVAWLESIRV